jgi:hypothetical protein
MLHSLLHKHHLGQGGAVDKTSAKQVETFAALPPEPTGWSTVPRSAIGLLERGWDDGTPAKNSDSCSK